MPVLRAAEPTLPAGRLAVLYDKNKMVRLRPCHSPAHLALVLHHLVYAFYQKAHKGSDSLKGGSGTAASSTLCAWCLWLRSACCKGVRICGDVFAHTQ